MNSAARMLGAIILINTSYIPNQEYMTLKKLAGKKKRYFGLSFNLIFNDLLKNLHKVFFFAVLY